ncbi:MAG: class I SAM-dependent methyltransferase [Pseudomonadota bacterium]
MTGDGTLLNREERRDGYRAIVAHYERCLETHGTGARAVDWKNAASAQTRYGVMRGLFAHEREPVSILDFGCGLGAFRTYLDGMDSPAVAYEGLDLSPAFAEATRQAHPGVTVHCLDVLQDDSALPEYDYAVLNGIFTRRETLSETEMLDYLARLTLAVFRKCRRGLAFNVMSHAVDWKAETLFHPAPGDLVDLITTHLSHHFSLRNDYGLYECTCYVYREPVG